MEQVAVRRRRGRVVAFGSILYLGIVLLIAVALPGLGDRWWPATLFLYGPRWLVAAPLLVLVPAALVVNRRSLLPLAAAAALVLVPIMGFSLPIRALLAGERPRDLRVVSFNTQEKALDVLGLKELAAEVRPDLMALQECKADQAQLARAFPRWSVHADLGMCLVSRHPIEKVESRDRTDVWERGGSGAIVRYTIKVQDPSAPEGRLVTLVNVHLETVRDAIEALIDDPWGGGAEHDRNVAERAWESELAREWVDGSRKPVIIAGDFNMPVESAIYRRYWSGFENAFSRAGVGFGATKATRWFGIRIDHVLLGPGLRTEAARVGPAIGSDHRPMIADVSFDGAG